MHKNWERPKSNFCIYGLIDPRNNELRYIGQTVIGAKRFLDHTNTNKNLGTHKRCWVKSLKDQGLIFDTIIFQEFPDASYLNEAEEFYVDYYRSIGANLVNHHRGGQDRYKMTEEMKKLISERTKAAMKRPEVVAKVKAYTETLKGKLVQPKGYKHNENAIKNIKLAQQKLLADPEKRKKRMDAVIKSHNKKVRDNKGNEFCSVTEAAKFYNYKRHQIYQQLKGTRVKDLIEKDLYFSFI